MAWSWFRQSGVLTSHPPAGNANRWAAKSGKNRKMKKILTVLSIIVTMSCSNPAINSVPTLPAQVPSATPLVKLTTTENSVVSTVCPTVQPLEQGLPLAGSLIYSDNSSNFILSFPNLITTEIQPERIFTDGTISPNGKYFVTSTTLYGDDGSYQGDYLDVLDSSGDFVASEAWKKEWTENPVWLNNNEVILSFQNGAVLIYDPFQKTTHFQSISLPDSQNLHVENLDPSFNTVIYSYYDNASEADFGQSNNAIGIRDIKNQKDILVLKDEYSSLVSRIVSSNDRNKVAITTVTPNEQQNHSEIMVVNNEDSSFATLNDFRSLFDEITITDIAWSLDDNEIYFWAFTNGNKSNLFSINLESNQVKQYCILGNSQANSIVWLKNASGFYLVTDSRNYTNQDQEEWDVLLVDSRNNNAYVVAKNVTLFGWLTVQ